jgi:hypothetical protein
MAGLCLALVFGGLHTVAAMAGADTLPLFVVGFLLPLVSGAAGHLLPVWLRPGLQDAWHRASRARLAAGARLRAVLLLAGGVLAALGSPLGYALGVFGALWLALGMAGTALGRK